MGTSSIYNGPKDKNPLLPEGFEEEYDPNQQENADNQEPSETSLDFPWQATKKSMSQFINGRSQNRGRIARNYVRALGGATNAAKSAKAAKSSTIQLGKFLSDIITEGIEKTLSKLEIEFHGKSVESLFSELVNVVAGNSNSKEDIAAKNASMEALSELYEFLVENAMDIRHLEKMDANLINKVMKTFVNSYLIERLLKDLQSRFEKYADDLSIAVAKENEVKEYITESVAVKLDQVRFNNLDYRSKNIDQIVEGIYRDCYEVLEAYI
ncbi:Qat anti-phage system associated protein QatB [Neobacillus drentensis]|uniref:Qat anti-phage system associated protein QatB n=1 Tax=Neobacillus drentensis TaxID=220684 RepID=UPI002FFF87DC